MPDFALPVHLQMSTDQSTFQKLVTTLASGNQAAGGRNSACVIVDNASGQILAQAADQVVQSSDPLATAVLLAMKEATAKRNVGDKKAKQASESGKGLTVFFTASDSPLDSAALSVFGADVVPVSSTSSNLGDAQPCSKSSTLKNGHLVNEVTAASASREHNASSSIATTMFKDIPARRPEFQNANQVTMPTWGDATQNQRLLSTSNDKHRRTVSHRGTPTANLVKDIRELNALVRSHYAKFITDVGMHLRPAIIASDYEPGFQGVGGTFKLYMEDGSVEHMTPAPASYQILKALCHVTLGISSIVLPYLESPHAQGWQNGLTSIGKQIDLIHANLKMEGLTLDLEVISFIKDMLEITNDYVKETLKNGFVDADAFHSYTTRVGPYIRKGMANAGRVQVEADLPALMEWKKKLGEKWKDVYVIIPTVWPVAGDNPRERMLAFLLPNPSVQIIKVQNQSSEAELFTTLGRVVGDRSVAAMVFGSDNEFGRDSQLALSTPRDLVSSACADAMVNYLHKCPPEEAANILSDLSPEALHAITAMRASTEPLPISPAIKSFYADPMTAQAFGSALHAHQAHPGAHPTSSGAPSGCPFGK